MMDELIEFGSLELIVALALIMMVIVILFELLGIRIHRWIDGLGFFGLISDCLSPLILSFF